MRRLRVAVTAAHASGDRADLADATVRVLARDGASAPDALDVERTDGGWVVAGFRASRDGYVVVVDHPTSRQRDVVGFTLDDVLARPARDPLTKAVVLEPVDGTIDLSVESVDADAPRRRLDDAVVTVGAHRVGAWRGKIRLVGVPGGGRPRRLAVTSRLARFVLVGFGPASASGHASREPPEIRAGAAETAARVAMRAAAVTIRALEHGSPLDGATATLRVHDAAGHGGDDADAVRVACGAATAVVASEEVGGTVAALHGHNAAVVLDAHPGEARTLPRSLLAPPDAREGARVVAPDLLYVVDVAKEGYRQVSHRDADGAPSPFAIPVDAFRGTAPVRVDVALEPVSRKPREIQVFSDFGGLYLGRIPVDSAPWTVDHPCTSSRDLDTIVARIDSHKVIFK